MRWRFVLALSCGAVTPSLPSAEFAEPRASSASDRCVKLEQSMRDQWPERGTRLVSATWQPAGAASQSSPGVTVNAQLPEHCEVIGILHERRGMDGMPYAIRFHVRMPAKWNHRLFMQGGAGLNGVLGDAIGAWPLGSGAPALTRGYAVISQDSGHDNEVMTRAIASRAFQGDSRAIAKYGGTAEVGDAVAFGRDPQARAEYAGSSLPLVAEAAKSLLHVYYGAQPDYSYFVGCSKGGQEGMYLAQRHPKVFNGIAALSPGLSLPRNALAQMWDIQQLATLAARDGKKLTPAQLAAVFTDADLALVSNAVLAACDADDGVTDGMVGNFPLCTSAKVLPELKKSTCAGPKSEKCLTADQLATLERIHGGARTAAGESVYAGYPWDAGWSTADWRTWRLGSADAQVPSRDLMLVAPMLAELFTTPPVAVSPGAESGLAYALSIDIDRYLPRLYATSPGFPRSAWDDISTRSADLGAFSAQGGKMVVPHGVSDAIFSIEDTLQWWREVDQRSGGRAAATVRVFPVPGMPHCGGGPAAADFDSLLTLERWVEHGEAPDHLIGRAGPDTPWPGRTRPLCAYPRMPRYKGHGDINVAASFDCLENR